MKKIYTLGPSGTNCESAAHYYSKKKGVSLDVVLFYTLEEAAEEVVGRDDCALLICIVYPDLHKLCFPYLGRLKFKDVFLFNTHNMVLASVYKDQVVRRVASHPAPSPLAPSASDLVFANSNVEAAMMCRSGEVEACITTSVAAEHNDLHVVSDFGSVTMGFAIRVSV